MDPKLQIKVNKEWITGYLLLISFQLGNIWLVSTVKPLLRAALLFHFTNFWAPNLLSKNYVLLRLFFEGGSYSRAALNNDFTVISLAKSMTNLPLFSDKVGLKMNRNQSSKTKLINLNPTLDIYNITFITSVWYLCSTVWKI